MTKKLITVLEYALLKDCSVQNVYKKIRRNTVKAVKSGKTWLIEL